MDRGRLYRAAVREGAALLREIPAIAVTAATYVGASFLVRDLAPNAEEIWEKRYVFSAAVRENLLVWYVPITVIGIGFIFLLFRQLGRERASFIGLRTISLYIAPLRDYLAVLFLSFVSATLVGTAIGCVRVPAGLLLGVVCSVILPMAIVNMAGLTRPPVATMIEIAIVLILTAAGMFLPGTHGGETSGRDLVGYFISVAVIYNLSCGVSTLAWPERSLAITLKHRLFSYPVWLLLHFASILLILVPVLLMMIVWIFAYIAHAVFYLIAGIPLIGDVLGTRLLEELVLFDSGSRNLAIAFSVYRFVGMSLITLASEAARGVPRALAEIISIILSIHLIVAKYRPDVSAHAGGKD